MKPQDEEQRRKGLVNRMRRLLFGLTVSCFSIPFASAATGRDEADSQPKVLPQKHRADAAVLKMEPERGASPAVSDSLIQPQSFSRTYTLDSSRPYLHYAPLVTDDLRILRAGVGVDLNMPDFGNLHFNLYSRDGDINKGKRWNISPSDSAGEKQNSNEEKVWSLGGSLELARTHPGGGRRLVFVPQMMFNLDSLQSDHNKMQAILQYSYWPGGGDADNPHPVPQISFKWSF